MDPEVIFWMYMCLPDLKHGLYPINTVAAVTSPLRKKRKNLFYEVKSKIDVGDSIGQPFEYRKRFNGWGGCMLLRSSRSF